MRHSTLKKRAKIVDLVIDQYKRVRHRKNFPRKIVADVVCIMFPDSAFEGRGVFKEVHSIRSRARKLVLKLSNAKSTKRDWQVYRSLPAGIRNRYFAKIYWHTKYCLLQKFGEEVDASKPEVRWEVKGLRMRVAKWLKDVKPDNVRQVDGHLKIVDAHPQKKVK